MSAIPALPQPVVRKARPLPKKMMSPLAVRRTLRLVAILVVGLGMAFPLLYMLSLSLMTPTDVSAYPPHLLPPTVDWHSYVDAINYLSFRPVLNSTIFSLSVVVLQLTIGVMAGFALAKIPFRGATVIVALFVVPMFLPSNVAIIPTYVIAAKLGWVNTYAGMIIPIVGQTAFATLLFRQFFVNVPRELIEAARIDGAGWFNVLGRIAIPLARPAIAAYCSVTFLGAWNMYIWPLIIAPKPEMATLPVALAPLARSQYQLVTPNVGLAAAVLSTLPVLLVFLLTQKWYVRGVVGTGVD